MRPARSPSSASQVATSARISRTVSRGVGIGVADAGAVADAADEIDQHDVEAAPPDLGAEEVGALGVERERHRGAGRRGRAAARRGAAGGRIRGGA